MSKRKAAFFDRDGTLIKDVNYISKISEIELLPGVIDFCLLLKKKGYLLFVVTNQSGIARGYFDEDFVQKTHKVLEKIFADRGVFFSDFYYCPHHPDDKCLCRKPLPGLILRAAKEHDINLSQSLMFGDKESDIQAGKCAGCKSFYIHEYAGDL